MVIFLQGRAKIDQSPFFEEEKNFLEQIDIANKKLADTGEGESPTSVLSKLIDNEISVLLVNFGGSSD
jgi:hypothetical protein